MMRLVVITASETAAAQLSEAYGRLTDRQKEQLRLVLMPIAEAPPAERLADFERQLGQADFVLFDAHGADKEAVSKLADCLRRLPLPTVPVGNDAKDIRPLLRLGTLTAADLPEGGGPPSGAEHAPLRLSPDRLQAYAHATRMSEYWRGGGADNLFALICLAGREYGGCAQLPEPAEPVYVRELCLFDPSALAPIDSLSRLKERGWHIEGRPTVAFFFLVNGNPQETGQCVTELIERIVPFANPLPIAFPSVMNVSMERLRELLVSSGAKADLIVNLLPFRLGIGPGTGTHGQPGAELLAEVGVPVLHPFFLAGTTLREWQQSVRGVSPSQLLVQMMLPELDGNIETVPVAALQETGEDAGLGVPLKKLALIPERADRLAARIRRWLHLRTSANGNKRLALICYNYPPGEANAFGGAFLDTFASVSRLLSRLKREGYQVEELTAEQLRERFVSGGLVNSAQWSDVPDEMIRCDAADLPDLLQGKPWGDEAAALWGAPPGDVMTDDGRYLIPGIVSGNVFIGLQPARGLHEQPELSYHDRSLLPTHQYTAFYRWLKDRFAADAVVHVGTHGTLEFQRGKECAMSGECIPDDFIGDLPHLYLYYVGNPSEAMIAKRRAHAVLIGYQAPPFEEMELYGEWLELEALLHEYREAEQLDPDRCREIWRMLGEKAEALRFACSSPEQAEEELYRMRRSLVPSGLHVLGEGFSPEDAEAHMRHVLRHERGDARSLRGLLAERRGGVAADAAARKQPQTVRELDDEADAVVKAYLAAGELPAEYVREPEAWRSALLRTLEYGRRAYQSSMANREWEGLLRALGGEYVPAKLAGDALRNPEVLPSGSNLVQFDPRGVPSPAAVERGMSAAEQTIARYLERHGAYPHTVAVVLWGLETSRTQGETIGQILHYLGVRPAARSGGMRAEYEIVPMDQLGRPRLNVVVNISGLFRDLFPNLLEELNRVFRQVAELNEPADRNYFKAQSDIIAKELSSGGYSGEQIADLAPARIFGPAEGEYGTPLTGKIETRQWAEESELGEAYAASMNHVYSLKARGRAEPGLSRSHLSAVDIVSQIRSTHEWEVTDSDHYYEYFGGLAKAVEGAKGSRAEMYITDSTGERTLADTAKDSIARAVRTRLTNPQWIDGLLKHPHHGAQSIARRFEHVLGLAATTGEVEPWVFEQLHAVYVADEERSRQLEENNRFAYHAMIERLLESGQRGYWQPSEPELEQLRSKYLSAESRLEEAAISRG